MVFLADVEESLATSEQFRRNFHVSLVSLISLVSLVSLVSLGSLRWGGNSLHQFEFPAGFGREFLRAMLAIALRIAEMNAVCGRHGRIWESVVASRGNQRGSAEMTRGLEFQQH